MCEQVRRVRKRIKGTVAWVCQTLASFIYNDNVITVSNQWVRSRYNLRRL